MGTAAGFWPAGSGLLWIVRAGGETVPAGRTTAVVPGALGAAGLAGVAGTAGRAVEVDTGGRGVAGAAGRGCTPEWDEVGWNPGTAGGAPGLPAGTGPVRTWEGIAGRGPDTAAGFATGEIGAFDGRGVG